MNYEGEITKGFTPTIQIHCANVLCEMTELLEVIDKRTGKMVAENPESLKKGNSALIEFTP
jgi:elongation factor 1-alpha